MILGVRKGSMFWLVVVCCAIASQAQGSKPAGQNPASNQPVYFNADAREVIQPATLSADKVSATSIGTVLTLLLQGARVSLQSATDPLTASWIGTVRIPTRPGAKPPRFYIQQIRGSVDKTADTKVTLLFSLGGRTFNKEYPYGTKSSGDITLPFSSPVLPRRADNYIATVVIIVERRNVKGAALVDIGSLDVNARSTISKGKK